MRSRIKSMLKKEKGFTLVELLAVLVILGIVVAIAIPAIGNVIINARDDADEATKTMIIDAARLYEIQYVATDEEPNALPVSVDGLLKDGYIDQRQAKELPEGTVSRVSADGEEVGQLVFTPAANSDNGDED